MVENDSNRLGPYSRILFIIALAILILILPGLVRRGFIVALSATFSIIFVFLAAYGVLVLWSDRQNFRKWYRQLLKWAVIIDLALALVLTMAYILTATPITLAGFELHFVDRVIATYSAEGWLVLALILWASVVALTWFFVAALTGTIWLVVKPLQNGIPNLLEEIRKISFDKSDPWPRRVAAWFLMVPKVIDPSQLRLDVQPLQVRRSRRRLFRSVAWQIAIGTVIGMYVSLNPTILTILPFAQTYELISIPVAFLPLLVLPLMTLEALGAKIPGPRADFHLNQGVGTRVLQLMLTLGGLFWILWWAIGRVGFDQIVLTFSIYVVLLFLFSILTTFIYVRFFEEDLVDHISSRFESIGHELGKE